MSPPWQHGAQRVIRKTYNLRPVAQFAITKISRPDSALYAVDGPATVLSTYSPYIRRRRLQAPGSGLAAARLMKLLPPAQACHVRCEGQPRAHGERRGNTWLGPLTWAVSGQGRPLGEMAPVGVEFGQPLTGGWSGACSRFPQARMGGPYPGATVRSGTDWSASAVNLVRTGPDQQQPAPDREAAVVLALAPRSVEPVGVTCTPACQSRDLG
jgi:hypothetical protein